MPKVKVVMPENLRDKVEAINVVASSIAAISEGIKTVRKGPLTEEAILLLIQSNCRSTVSGKTKKLEVPMSTIKAVLNSMDSLAETYLK